MLKAYLTRDFAKAAVGMRKFTFKCSESVLMQCFCGSKIVFSQCCEIFLKGIDSAKTPEQLMRSRFSAYCMQQIDYIFQTYHPDQQANNQKHDIARFAASSHFVSLNVLASSGQKLLPTTQVAQSIPTEATSSVANANAGYVEFVVSYIQAGKLHQFTEVSRFLPVFSVPITAPQHNTQFEQLAAHKQSAASIENSANIKNALAPQVPDVSLQMQSANPTALQSIWQWRYIDGALTSHPSRTIGRNDPCPCGSGKKFKQCQNHNTAGQFI